jgi:hypothetical protein
MFGLWEAMREIYLADTENGDSYPGVLEDWMEAWLLGVPPEMCGCISMIAWRV